MKMRWINKRILFDPSQNNVFESKTEFAQSPQTVVFDDFVRIYFSTRKRESSGKFLSYIAFIDVNKNLDTIINHSSKEVIPLGELGTFDEHGIFPINVLKEENRILAYTCGWSRRVSVSVETSIGLAISEDNGLTYKKYGHGPIVSSSLKEPVLVGDAFVKKFDGVYHMWYMFGQKWINATANEPEARVYKIAHATSLDGMNWNKEEGIPIIPNVLNENECQALPTVLKIGSRYHMYFCFREATDFRTNPKRGYQLGYAYSDDLKSWVRADDEFSISRNENDWDSEMRCYPHIFKCDSNIYLLYNGNQFGKFGFGIAQLQMEVKHEFLKFDMGRANFEMIYSHLKSCDDQFTPLLSQQVNIQDYAKKITDLAITFEAWDANKLISLIAVYFNDYKSKIGYITNVSVEKNHHRRGIADQLLKNVKTYAIAQNFKSINLEVNKSNTNAISLYKKHNFEVVNKNNNVITMSCHLK